MLPRRFITILFAGLCVLLLDPVVLSREASLGARIAVEIARARFGEKNVAVAVVDENGELVVGINELESFKPASNQKLVTTAAALHFLGPDYTFETQVWACASLVRGAIAGDILVRGGGDPNISGRFHDDVADHLLRLWAARLYDAGLRRIDGDVIADDRFFDDERFVPGWNRSQEASWYSAQISALSLNDNCLDITVRPASAAGQPARVEIEPPCSLLQIEASPKTIKQGKTSILVHRKTGTNVIRIKGSIRKDRAFWKGHVTVDDPALFFAGAFVDALRKTGITVTGIARKAVRVDARASSVSGASDVAETRDQKSAPECDRGQLLVQHASTLMEDLPVIQKRSQNLHAELLLKTLGARISGEGSRSGGERAIRRFLREKRIPTDGLVVGDGSGLSHDNRLTALLLAHLLHSTRGEPYFEQYRGALPVAGIDGTLKTRFRKPSVARGNVFAKTGFIRGVSALSGFVARGDRLWSFSILVNGFPPGVRSPKRLQERICEALYGALAPPEAVLAK